MKRIVGPGRNPKRELTMKGATVPPRAIHYHWGEMPARRDRQLSRLTNMLPKEPNRWRQVPTRLRKWIIRRASRLALGRWA